MDSNEKIGIAAAYIDEHFAEEITMSRLEEVSGYSLRHLEREFSGCYGISVAAYIRRMRLRAAAGKIYAGVSVTAAAEKYGFSSAKVFSRAFRREFGVSPREYKAHSSAIRESAPAPAGEMKPRLKILPRIRAVCYPLTRKQSSVQNLIENSAYWYNADFSKYDTDGFSRVSESGRGEIGVWYRKFPDARTITYMYGVWVDEYGYVPHDMRCIELPAACYAVFTTQPTDLSHDVPSFYRSVGELWSRIFKQWLPENGKYELDPNGLCFESYAPANGCNSSENAVMDIYVPVRTHRQ